MATLNYKVSALNTADQNDYVIPRDKVDVPRGHKFKFSPEEDESLRKLVLVHGTNKWSLISKLLKYRTARQCRDRWNHYLSRNGEQAPWTESEDQRLLKLHTELGSKWTIIATHFEGRNSVSIRNRCCRLIRRMNSKKSKKSIETSASSSEEVSVASPIVQRIVLPSCTLLPFPWK